MRKILLLIVLFGATITGLRAQVGIGTKDPDKRAQLEIQTDSPTTNRGLLIPRVGLEDLEMLLTGATSKSDMPQSILVFNTKKDITGYDGKTYGIGYYYWDVNVDHPDFKVAGKGAWVPLLSGGSAANINNFFNNFKTESSTVVYNKTDNTLKVNVGNGLKEYVDAVAKKTYVGLGGDLKEDTTINFATKKLKLEGVPMTDKYDDKILVWNEGSKEFKYSDGINVKQISAVDPSTGNSDANKGKILTVDNLGNVVWTTIDASNTKTVNLTNVAGDGLTYSSTTGELSVNAGNGLKVEGDKVKLGGKLDEATEIDASANTLAVKGLKDGADTDVLVVADPSTGVLKKVAKVSTKQIDGGGTTNEGKILTVDNTGAVKWDVIDASNTKTIDLSGVAGDGLTYSSTTGKLDIGAGNGITVTSNTVDWGGKLTKTATIETADSKGFEIKPKDPSGKSNVVIKELPDGASGDKLVVVDGDGKLKQIAPLDAATINYTDGPQETGRKWTLPLTAGGARQDKKISEITLEVEFNNQTYVDLAAVLATKGVISGPTKGQEIKVISIRAIEKTDISSVLTNDKPTSVTQSGVYDPKTGLLTLGMSSSTMFSVTFNGTFYIVVEYFKI